MEGIESISKESRHFPPPKSFSSCAHIKSKAGYQKIYRRSIAKPQSFWAEQAQNLHWFSKWKGVFSWDKHNSRFTWFKGGKLNVSYNCLDRHLESRGNKVAIIWQGETEEQVRKFTYRELYHEVSRFASVLLRNGVRKGDRVCVYMPMIPELAIAMLACTRIGAIHSIVFAGFSAESLRDRMTDSKCSMLITADGGYHAGKDVHLKEIADEALAKCPFVKKVIVAQRTGERIAMKKSRDIYWNSEMASAKEVPAAQMDAEDPLFILYTSGTTGKPKGVLHTTGGYLTYTDLTFRWVFDYKEDDVYWCTADIGWITGHSYIVYGPLSNGATTLMFEGVPTFPENDRFWRIIDKFYVSVFYTAPTAIRALMRYGQEPVKKHKLDSLRLLGSVGEPINPEAWIWYHKYIGKGKCPIVDTWWQTETGGIMITPLPGATTLLPGSATHPFPGVEAAIFTEEGKEAKVNEGGYLVIRKPTPGLARTIYGDHKKYVDTYWTRFKGAYFAGDGARKDREGNFWIVGRIDDVVNVSGHRIGTAEVESAIVSHKAVAEAAIVPFPHEIKGQALYAFVTLKKGVSKTPAMADILKDHVGKKVGHIAKPDKIQFADALPKTRSGKIMRRILRSIAEGKTDVGNTTTLADPGIVDILIKGRV